MGGAGGGELGSGGEGGGGEGGGGEGAARTTCVSETLGVSLIVSPVSALISAAVLSARRVATSSRSELGGPAPLPSLDVALDVMVAATTTEPAETASVTREGATAAAEATACRYVVRRVELNAPMVTSRVAVKMTISSRVAPGEAGGGDGGCAGGGDGGGGRGGGGEGEE